MVGGQKQRTDGRGDEGHGGVASDKVKPPGSRSRYFQISWTRGCFRSFGRGGGYESAWRDRRVVINRHFRFARLHARIPETRKGIRATGYVVSCESRLVSVAPVRCHFVPSSRLTTRKRCAP